VVGLGKLPPTAPVFFPKRDQSFRTCREDCNSYLSFSVVLLLFTKVRKFGEDLVFSVVRNNIVTSASSFIS